MQAGRNAGGEDVRDDPLWVVGRNVGVDRKVGDDDNTGDEVRAWVQVGRKHPQPPKKQPYQRQSRNPIFLCRRYQRRHCKKAKCLIMLNPAER